MLMQEMQRSLFLLSGMARLLGQWQIASPGSLFTARQVAASFLARVAQARPGERFSFYCPPVSPSEKASLPSRCHNTRCIDFDCTGSADHSSMHYKICALTVPKLTWLPCFDGTSDGEEMCCSNVQAQAEQEPGLQAGEGWFDVCSEGSQPAGSRRSPTQRHSEYSACLGEAVYSAAAQALSFLCAVAPQVSASSSSLFSL